jgi:hypothetical protein
MNITDIKNATNQSIDYRKYVPSNVAEQPASNAVATAANKAIADKNDISAKPQNWDQQILLDGLDILENNIQKTNTGRLLDKSENRPIQDFAEAVKELNAAKLDFQKKEASAAQANIPASVAYELLTEG